MSKAPKRIYLVRNSDTGVERLIRAANVAQARNHAARDTLAVEVASQEKIVELFSTFGKDMLVEDAGVEGEAA